MGCELGRGCAAVLGGHVQAPGAGKALLAKQKASASGSGCHESGSKPLRNPMPNPPGARAQRAWRRS